MLPAVFVSYSHQDVNFARQLVADLRPLVRSVWFDERSINPGRYWDNEIQKGIHDADVFLFLMTPYSLASIPCQDEFDAADRLKKPIIPLLVTHCDQLWVRIARRQWIDFRSDYSTALNTLIQALSHNLGDFRIPLPRTCPVCRTTFETDYPYCPNGHAYQPAKLGELYGLKSDALQAYLKIYQPRENIPNASIEDLLVVALTHLMSHSFDVATTLLERILRIQPTYAYAHYALALAGLRGRRPRSLSRDEAILAQSRALNALNNDISQSHIALFLALLKSDYFESQCFRIDPPGVSDCLAIANQGTTTIEELNALLTFVPVEDGPIVAAIRAAIRK